MKITITGPRSVGKSTISKLVSEYSGLEYVSSDEKMEYALKRYGGLDAVIKAKSRTKELNDIGIDVVANVLIKDNIIFDLAGGAINSRDNDFNKSMIKLLKANSAIFGLLPNYNDDLSIEMLFYRERIREHFKDICDQDLREKVERDYLRLRPMIIANADYVIYTLDQEPEKIAEKIVNQINYNRKQ